MILKPEQINELLGIIDRNQLVVIGQELGPDFLTTDDKALLKKNGVDVDNLYSASQDTIFTNFHLGMLAESLGALNTAKLSFDQLKDYISHGDYIPLTGREEGTISAIKNQTFTDLKKLGNKIFSDVNGVLTDRSIKGQREFIREELEQGTLDKDTVTQIAHNIARKTGDWSRDFERIVAYNAHLAMEEGKAFMIERNAGTDDVTVYKTVFDGACQHCVRLFLTDGIGSQPRLFKLSELRANGTNIGIKVAEWKATISPIHPFCRCALHYLPEGHVWDKKKKEFVAGKIAKNIKPKRKLIKVWINGKEELI